MSQNCGEDKGLGTETCVKIVFWCAFRHAAGKNALL